MSSINLAIFCAHAIFDFFVYSDDDNHIVLQPIPDRSDCKRNYINASYINVKKTGQLLSHMILFFVTNYRERINNINSSLVKVAKL